MIRVLKPEQAPPILRQRGQRTTETNQRAFEDGARTFKFDNSLYGAKSVKDALIEAQRGKCAFCESKVRHVAYGDVEHYRPKGGVRQSDDDPLEQPGYFWLAYVWDNLFFVCQLCNQRFKKNLFPLADPSRRARSHRDDLAAEEPMLIHPGDDDPSALIGFRQEVAFAIDGGQRGQATVDILRLNREELVERRWDRLRLLQASRDLLRLQPTRTKETRRVRQLLEDATRSDTEYASMARWLLDEPH
jgi:uncharacterized protein (TIGR02646 family)